MVDDLEDSTVSNIKKKEIKPKGLAAPFGGKRGVTRKKTSKQTQNQLSAAPLYPITEAGGTHPQLQNPATTNNQTTARAKNK